MNLPDVPLMSILRQRMAWLSQRQDVLAQNVANADTPGFTARDLKPMGFDDMMKQPGSSGDPARGLSVTNARHIALSPTSTAGYGDFAAPDIEANPQGNSVSLEEQMIKVADTQAQFQAASNLYSKAIDMMRTAIGHGGN